MSQYNLYAMRAIYLLSFLILFSGPSLLPAQENDSAVEKDFTGVWLGKLSQRLDPPFNSYVLRLELKQRGNIVTGRSHIHVTDSVQLYAEMDIKGIVKEGKLYFREEHITDSHHLANWDWCLKKGILSLEDKGKLIQMTGPWEGWVGRTRCESGNLNIEKINIVEKEEDVEKEVVVVEEPKQDIKKNEPEEKEEPKNIVEGRRITRQKTVKVKADEFVAYIWDANKEDGDVISLKYNGEWILRNYTIQNRKRPIRIKVEPGADNRLILFAEDLGTIPPNTCALTFFDGERERTLSLVSDRISCGALKFVRED